MGHINSFSSLQKTRVGGLDTAVLTRAELAELMVRDCKERSDSSLPKLVFSSNGQGVALAGRDPNFAAVMRSADVIHADGMSVVIASKLLTPFPLPERISTTDFFDAAAEVAMQQGLSFFFLGGNELQNARVVEVVQKRYPGLIITGRRNGYFRAEEESEICTQIRESGTDVLWVALGKPLQEQWSLRNRDNLQGVAWIKTCGGLYGHIVGDEKRAPVWMQNYGLEWLYRVIQNPRRLWWRYLVTNPQSLWRMIVASGNVNSQEIPSDPR